MLADICVELEDIPACGGACGSFGGFAIVGRGALGAGSSRGLCLAHVCVISLAIGMREELGQRKASRQVVLRTLLAALVVILVVVAAAESWWG